MWTNRRKILVTAAVLGMAIVAVAGFTVVNNMEKNKISVALRNVETDTEASVDGQVGENTSLASGQTDYGWKETVGDNIICLNDLKVEMISCDIIPDTELKSQTKYPEKNFITGEFPDTDFVEENTDWDAVYNEAPEYKKICENGLRNYSDEEQKEIADKYQPIIDKNTTSGHPVTNYYFIKCRVSNELDHVVEEPLSIFVLFLSENRDRIWYEDSYYYFDKSEHTEGDDRGQNFFKCRLEPGESTECTIGIEVKRCFGAGETYYFGDPPATDDLYNPDTVPDLVRADMIPVKK